MAWQIEQGDRCPNCDTYGHEWEEDPYAYEAKVVYCPGDAVKAREWDRWKRESGAERNPDIAKGMTVVLRRR